MEKKKNKTSPEQKTIKNTFTQKYGKKLDYKLLYSC